LPIFFAIQETIEATRSDAADEQIMTTKSTKNSVTIHSGDDMQPDSHTASHQIWFVYLVRCRDRSLYAGITTDLGRRLSEHNNSAKGAKYTKARRPVTLAYWEAVPDRSAAASREYALKRLSPAEKEQLVATVTSVLPAMNQGYDHN
jgi:putative endonuclease